MQKFFKSPVAWILIIVVSMMLIWQLFSSFTGFQNVPTSQTMELLQSDQELREVLLVDGEQQIQVTDMDGNKTQSVWVGEQQIDDVISLLEERKADGTLERWDGLNPSPGLLSMFLYTGLPFLILLVAFFFIFRMMNSGGAGGPLSFGKSRAKLANKDTPQTTFADVAGADEAVEELVEIKEFLEKPAKFAELGAKIPKGVLLYGPPGTGKTLLARAVAGEAGVPFFSISGSDFVEMFVGVGASRVRDLFSQAKENAPAIVFIDEIDAVGRHRGAGMGGGHDEREQTLNQLLVEMDGFDARGGVILIAATNRPDVLDPALLRPGRFDRQISVEAPDAAGREHILRVHAKGKPLASTVDLASIARRTPGFSGADLANVLNEAALLAAREGKDIIGQRELDEAIDRVIAGPQKKTRLMNEKERLITAYHEGGHALVAAAMPGNDPVQKVTILPRGRALGYTMVLPDQDKYSQTRGELLDQMAYMMGGRAAEELVFHDPTTGASNDIEKATRVARAMVTQYGMSERIGAVKIGGGDSEPFMGMRGTDSTKEYSDNLAAVVDEEVSKLIHVAHQEAFDVLEENRDVLDELVRQLFEKETLNKEQVAEIFKALRRREKRPAWTGSDLRVPSEIPPVQPPKSDEDEEPAGDNRPPVWGPPSAPVPPVEPPAQPPAGPSGWERPGSSDWQPPRS
ncbi:ATP-dependent zinc metalloprotease FtsH [Tessaracoccus oleiagri]|uniref:ATP-dependent zinc metalloprotease FtsH n=1 Tax=Tessaracoccus oleiagri TaxID=686624 RepID=A0A1G9MXU1_9ACTN|nr:ATP-dependent zinc metalloprotease FtsH [Tessaracoccus oleiagri]SDL78943.1 cell division protease FtsH [Tessaracoccus oleiagri]